MLRASCHFLLLVCSGFIACLYAFDDWQPINPDD